MFVYAVKGSNDRWRQVPIEKALNWFRNTITGLKTAAGTDRTFPTRIVPANLLGLSVVWVFVFLCLVFGIKWLGRISIGLVILPVLMILILLVRSVTLQGSRQGILTYIGTWDVSVWVDRPAVWAQAVTQVFFSLSVCLGVMTAYGSYNKRDSPVVVNSLIIASINFMFSFVAGFAVFGIIGYIAYVENQAIGSIINLEGPGTVFATIPFGISKLPGHGHWERFFFWTVFFLGMGSFIAIVESISTALKDTALLNRYSKKIILFFVCLLGFLASLLFATDTGMSWVETIDFYVKYAMVIVGILETFSVGWIYGIEKQSRRIGWKPTIAFMFATFGPLVFACGLWFGLDRETYWKGLVALFASYISMLGIVMFLVQREIRIRGSQKLNWKEAITELYVGNLATLQQTLFGTVGNIPFVWFILIKHFVPAVLVIVLAGISSGDINIALSVFAESPSSATKTFGNFGMFPVAYQIVGVSIFVAAMALFVIGVVLPGTYAFFDNINANTEVVDDVEARNETENIPSHRD